MTAIDRLLLDLNSDVLALRTGHEALRCKALRVEDTDDLLEDGVDFTLYTSRYAADFVVVNVPPLFKQCDPRWHDKRYSPQSSNTFCQSGCLVCSVASLAAWAGYDVDPVTFAEKAAEAGAFEGAELKHHGRVSVEETPVAEFANNEAVADAFPCLEWHEDSYHHWASAPADLDLLARLLDKHPVVVQLDFDPRDRDIDTHFVLAYEYVPAPDEENWMNDDLGIMDPMTGYTSVLSYFNPKWWGHYMESKRVTKVARTLTGARVWHVEA